MKTEPTINIQSEVAKIHSQFGMTEIANYHIEKLFEMYVKQSNPKIKQLEWEKSPFFKGNYEANFGLGKYFIDDCGGCITLVCPDHSLKNKFSTIDEAKSAAQRDFEKCIKECLE